MATNWVTSLDRTIQRQHPELEPRAGREMSGRDASREKDTTRDHRTSADHRVAAEDRCACVDDDIILESWMAFVPAPQRSIGLTLETLGTERDALVDPTALANHRCLTYDDARSMVDEQFRANLRGRMDIYSCLAMGVLAHHAREKWNTECIKRVGESMDEECPDTRIADDDLKLALGGRIAAIGRSDVLLEPCCQQRYVREKLVGRGGAIFRARSRGEGFSDELSEPGGDQLRHCVTRFANRPEFGENKRAERMHRFHKATLAWGRDEYRTRRERHEMCHAGAEQILGHPREDSDCVALNL
jgi:hypothetical protein